MKLLKTKSELSGIDSSEATIEKWDSFLKKAVYNLGYRQELIDGMYPYEKGIPMKDGTKLEVSPKTGRAIFQMSWADKLCAALSVVKVEQVADLSSMQQIRMIVMCLAERSKEFFNRLFNEFDYDTFVESLNLHESQSLLGFSKSEINHLFDMSEYVGRMWKDFIENSDIISSGVFKDHDSRDIRWDDEAKQRIAESAQACAYTRATGYSLYIISNRLDDVYDKFPGQDLIYIIDHLFGSYNIGGKFRSYNEVYLQDYLVISLNPIDKLMCSTKQAFASCMSIAKSNDSRGTNSGPALGLPSVFACDSIYMIFMTPGKHKNMYWEESEWIKAPEERDKEKAYKYLKMTCRCWTYKTKLTKAQRGYFKDLLNSDDVPDNVKEDIKALEADQPRLLVGRQYSAAGEDYVWQNMIEYLMARKGISTGTAYLDEITKVHDDISDLPEMTREQGYSADTQSIRYHSYLKYGTLLDHKFVCTDRYGYTRGIYYDNLTIDFKSCGYSGVRPEEPWIAKEDGEHLVRVGSTRTGSHGVQTWHVNPETDMFKVMMGEQSYSFMNSDCKICEECGEVLSQYITTVNGKKLCLKCAEKLGYKQCEACHVWYTKKEASDHELINIREFTNPKNYTEIEPKYVCKHQLKKCEISESNRTYLCAHCGSLVEVPRYYNNDLEKTTKAVVAGVEIRVSLCGNCLKRAVMCDRCKRVLFLDSVSDAMLLLPNRRVVCPDCIDNIRMKQERRQKIRDLLDNMELEDFRSVEEIKDDVLDKAMKDRLARASGYEKAVIIKDVYKQIDSYLQAHPEKSFPRLKSSNTPLEIVAEEETPEEIPY